jgi:hypothetical protein
MVVHIYQPSAPGGVVLSAHCPPEPRSVIRFERDSILVSAKASYNSEYPRRNGIGVRITFEVPEGKVVRLLDGVVEVSVPILGSFKGELSGPVPPGTPMAGETTKNKRWGTLYDPPSAMFAMTNHASYYFKTFLSMPNSDTFTLKLPKFLINDVEVELPVINFNRNLDFYIAGINC